MTFVYKEYEVKIIMVQGQWLQLKVNFLLDYNMKIVIRHEPRYEAPSKLQVEIVKMQW